MPRGEGVSEGRRAGPTLQCPAREWGEVGLGAASAEQGVALLDEAQATARAVRAALVGTAVAPGVTAPGALATPGEEGVPLALDARVEDGETATQG